MTEQTKTVIFEGTQIWLLRLRDRAAPQGVAEGNEHCAVTLGMKKTSVDQLTKAVGIAKGSFYKFYESKEMPFFAVLESIHSELYRSG